MALTTVSVGEVPGQMPSTICMPSRLLAALCDPTSAAFTSNPEGELADMAEALMHRFEIRSASGKRFRMVELEAYVLGDEATGHADPFAHAHAEQASPGQWYFHRASNAPNAKYKGGSFKGVDITFGRAGSVYAGMLLRGVIELGEANEHAAPLVSGPCNVVHSLLDAAGVPSIVELVHASGGNIGADGLAPATACPLLGIFPVEAELEPRFVPLAGPRIGLTLAKAAAHDGAMETYIARRYRWLAPFALGPKKVYAVLACAMNGESAEDAAARTKVGLKTVARQLDAFASGAADASATLAAVRGKGKMNVAQLCAMLGAAHALHG
ncbi:uncharacterized protein AMSG_08486 [Thecamonas trahens ATCC 50062]|uniref:Uncharacterized protein n=1 Tax=Thecamonas trahens ATCC 50062 TaxID=461836 RepID=A0A0L0DKQ8_THETB|nr:hypothetical protein AMSG_08486 [Thecamonas trahens ATCC 50062]KNC52621.1 hypothetical protein AMSG_08486 [Thecamonas trahens ATCC 50062]|eukprot:XP_013755178.1 hypothetical protein AMSG_08486 [Thecamonas trahens ATCC 50062]